MRRPLTATGTNPLGLLKHLTCCEIGYFATTFDRPITDPPPRLQATEHHEQFWARTDETREQILAAYTRAVQHSDATIAALPLDAAGEVPTWSPADRHVTLHRIMAHMTPKPSATSATPTSSAKPSTAPRAGPSNASPAKPTTDRPRATAPENARRPHRGARLHLHPAPRQPPAPFKHHQPRSGDR